MLPRILLLCLISKRLISLMSSGGSIIFSTCLVCWNWRILRDCLLLSPMRMLRDLAKPSRKSSLNSKLPRTQKKRRRTLKVSNLLTKSPRTKSPKTPKTKSPKMPRMPKTKSQRTTNQRLMHPPPKRSKKARNRNLPKKRNPRRRSSSPSKLWSL